MVKQRMEQASQEASRQTDQWKESFQAVAGSLVRQYRGDYDRGTRTKPWRQQTQYARPRYIQDVVSTDSRKVKYVRIEGKYAWLYFSQIAVYDLIWRNVAPQSTPTSSGTNSSCHNHHHHGQSYNWGAVRHDDKWGCHDMRMSNVIDGDTDGSPQNRWWDWGQPHTGGEGQRGGIFHSSSDSWPWFQLTLQNEIYVREVKLWQRYDDDRNRLSGFVLKLLNSNGGLIQQYTLTSADVQSYPGPALTCPSGYRKMGGIYDTYCIYNCAPGEPRDDSIRTCYQIFNGGAQTPCREANYYLEGGTDGTCKEPAPSGWTLSGNTFYENCNTASGEIELNMTTCYNKCKETTDDGSRPPKCYKACPSTHRLGVTNNGTTPVPGDDNCYPIRPEDYLAIAWRGPILSQADPAAGFSLSLGAMHGSKIGLWRPMATSFTDSELNNRWDQVWAYTEDMQLINMANRKCLDWGSDAPPHMWNCHGGNNQKWIIDSEGRIRAFDDKTKCLTVTDYTTVPLTAGGNPLARVNPNTPLRLENCTADGNKFQRFVTTGGKILPGLRTSLNGNPWTASTPPPLPTEPINREGFLATRDTEDAF